MATLANGNIPYHRFHAQFRNGGVGQGAGSFLALLVSVNSNPLLSGNLVFSGNSAKFGISSVLRLLLGNRLQISHRVVRKIVLSIVCFEYSLLSLLLSLVVVVFLVVLVFPLLSY